MPASWDVRSYSEDMDAMVNCAGCGYRLPFGEMYTSLAIHALPSGFGYGVCEICHEAEIKRDLRAKEAMNQNERKDA